MSGSMHRHGLDVNLKLEGITRWRGSVAYEDSDQTQDVTAFLGAALEQRAIDPGHGISPRVMGFSFSVDRIGTSGTIVINPPCYPGRRMKFTLSEGLGTHPTDPTRFPIVNVTIAVRPTAHASYNVISGSILNNVSSGSGAETRIVQKLRDQRWVRWNGHSTASRAPRAGDFIEFLDLGDRWLVHGVSGAQRSGTINPITFGT